MSDDIKVGSVVFAPCRKTDKGIRLIAGYYKEDGASLKTPEQIAREYAEENGMVLVPKHEKARVIGNDVIKRIVEQAHMAGQIDAGVDPSYSNSTAYYNDLFNPSEGA